MDRPTSFILAFSMLIAAALAVGVSGWILFVRDRHATRAATSGDEHREPVEGS